MTDKTFVVISDIHGGSKFSVTRNPKGQVQRKLREIWNGMIDQLSTISDLQGINLGDNCEGTDYHGKGEHNTSNSIIEQMDITEELLKEIPAKKWYFVQGSYYHTAQNLSSDRLIARNLGARWGDELVVNADGYRIHCSHAIGVSMASPAYRTTPIAREMMLATINEKEYGKFDLILRGHAHYFCRVQFGGSSGVICPCWKGRDTFAQTRTLAMMPHVGYVLVKTSSEGITIEPHIFSLKGRELLKEVKA